MKILKGLLMIITAPVILVLTLFVWLCTGLIYISGLVLGLFSTVIALLGVAVCRSALGNRSLYGTAGNVFKKYSLRSAARTFEKPGKRRNYEPLCRRRNQSADYDDSY